MEELSNIDEDEFFEEFDEEDVQMHEQFNSIFPNRTLFHDSNENRKPKYRFDSKLRKMIRCTYEPEREFCFAGVTYCSKDEFKAIIVKMRIYIHYLWNNGDIVLNEYLGNIKVELYDLYFINYLYYYFDRINQKQQKVKASNPTITSDNIIITNKKQYKWNITKDKVENATYWYKKMRDEKYLKNCLYISRIDNRTSIKDFLNSNTINPNNERDTFYLYRELLYNIEVKDLFYHINKMNRKQLSKMENNMIILNFLFRDFIPSEVLDYSDYLCIHNRFNKSFLEEYSRKFGNPLFIEQKLSFNIERYGDEFVKELSRFELEPNFEGVLTYYSLFV